MCWSRPARRAKFQRWTEVLGRGSGQGGEVAADIVGGTGVLIDDDFGDYLRRDELRQGARRFTRRARLRILANLGMEPVLGMRRGRRYDDRQLPQAGDAQRQTKK